MSDTFQRDGVRFHYPPDWQLETETEGVDSETVGVEIAGAAVAAAGVVVEIAGTSAEKVPLVVDTVGLEKGTVEDTAPGTAAVVEGVTPAGVELDIFWKNDIGTSPPPPLYQ